MKRYLYESIKNYLDENGVSYHVPGHKNGRAYIENYFDFSFDVTEIAGTDNLHNPTGAIYNSQRQVAEFYGAKQTYFLVNGTTCGIHAMILSCTKPKDKIIMCRNAHKSVYNACIMGDLSPIMAYPDMNSENGLILGICPKHLEKLFNEHYDIKAVIITSPTYEGINSDIKALAEITHKHGALLLVDEAHGSHIPLNKRCGLSAISQGADMTVQSTHKSLSALTQSSILHVGSDKVDIHKLQNWLSILQSSSPSYMLMLSLEKAVYDICQFGHDRMSKLILAIDNFHKYFDENTILKPNSVILNGYMLDITKITIFYKDAIALADYLRDKHNIQIEYAVCNYLVCVCSIWNTPEDIEKLKNALDKFFAQNVESVKGKDLYKKNLPKNKNVDLYSKYTNICASERKLSPKKAFYSKRRAINIKDAIGEICLETIVPYPPGIPLIMSGEIFTKEHYEYFMMCKNNEIDIIGQRDSELKTIDCL